MSKILFSTDPAQDGGHAAGSPVQAAAAVRQPNIFQGRPDGHPDPAKFPDWDILPPSQFINPRLRPSA